MPHVLLVFVDGLGLGEPDPGVNPLYRGDCPTLVSLLEAAVPVDARLDMPGVPQSATGQTALLTGVNAARKVGRHIEGFPGPALKEIIAAHNVFKQLQEKGYSGAFANAYYMAGWTEAERRKYQSVTTVATLSALGGVRDVDVMLQGKAVYQDLTRELLLLRGYSGPLITPVQAAADLYGIMQEHHFTLFEYFQTDRQGHAGQSEAIKKVLQQLDEFFAALLSMLDHERCLFLLISDHGNIEDSRSKGHTMNPVPFVAEGLDARFMQERVSSLPDFVPALLAYFSEKCP